MAIKLTNLPDDCILQILVPISLADQIRYIQLVCHRLGALHQVACRRIKSLVLVGPHGFYPGAQYRYDNYRYLIYFLQKCSQIISFKHRNYYLRLSRNNCLSSSLCQYLINKFTNIICLDLVQICLKDEIDGENRLLEGWKAKLLEVKVLFIPKEIDQNGQSIRFENQSNRCVHQLL